MFDLQGGDYGTFANTDAKVVLESWKDCQDEKSSAYNWWNATTARFAESATIAFVLLQLPQIILNTQNILAGDFLALSAIPWMVSAPRLLMLALLAITCEWVVNLSQELLQLLFLKIYIAIVCITHIMLLGRVRKSVWVFCQASAVSIVFQLSFRSVLKFIILCLCVHTGPANRSSWQSVPPLLLRG